MLALVAAAVGSAAFGALVGEWFRRRKTKAEAADIVAGAAAKAVELLRGENDRYVERLDALEQELAAVKARLDKAEADRSALETRVAELEAHIDLLETQMRAQGMTPPPRPRR